VVGGALPVTLKFGLLVKSIRKTVITLLGFIFIVLVWELFCNCLPKKKVKLSLCLTN
jgi:hypothetical protein